jgi:hypothetical protein
MGSHLFTSRSGLNLGIRMRKKHQHIFTGTEGEQNCTAILLNITVMYSTV